MTGHRDCFRFFRLPAWIKLEFMPVITKVSPPYAVGFVSIGLVGIIVHPFALIEEHGVLRSRNKLHAASFLIGICKGNPYGNGACELRSLRPSNMRSATVAQTTEGESLTPGMPFLARIFGQELCPPAKNIRSQNTSDPAHDFRP